MAAAAHSPAFAKKVGIPVSVAQEFNQADKGRKFKGGGMAKGKFPFESSKKDVEKKGKGKEGSKKEETFDRTQMMKCGGKVKKYAKGGGIELRGKTKGRCV